MKVEKHCGYCKYCFIGSHNNYWCERGGLGEIARHLIAVKEHIEDMRLDKDEWSMLEKLVI